MSERAQARESEQGEEKRGGEEGVGLGLWPSAGVTLRPRAGWMWSRCRSPQEGGGSKQLTTVHTALDDDSAGDKPVLLPLLLRLESKRGGRKKKKKAATSLGPTHEAIGYGIWMGLCNSLMQ